MNSFLGAFSTGLWQGLRKTTITPSPSKVRLRARSMNIKFRFYLTEKSQRGIGGNGIVGSFNFSTANHGFERVQIGEIDKQNLQAKFNVGTTTKSLHTGTDASVSTLTVYENHRPNHFRLLSLFAAGQSTYWTFMALDNFFLAPATADATSQSDSLVLAFYTHPFWSVFGMGFTVCLWGAVYAYSSHYVSQIDLYGHQGMRLRTHTLFGGKSEPIILRDRTQFNFGTSPPKDSDSYILLNVQKHQLNYLIDRKLESFFPNRDIDLGNNDSESGDEQIETAKRKKKEGELVNKFGQSWNWNAPKNKSAQAGQTTEELEPIVDSQKFRRKQKRLPRKRF